MKELTIGQQKILQDLNDYWTYAKNSDVRKKWLNQYQSNLKYYCGQHWDEKVLEEIDVKMKNFIEVEINREI